MNNNLAYSNINPEGNENFKDFFSRCRYLSPWETKGKSSGPNKEVVTCFLGKNKEVLVLQRGRKDAQYELWGIPGGKLSPLEPIIKGLQREIAEETGVMLDESSFMHLGSALSRTETDGEYGLHLFYAEFPAYIADPVINPEEHLSFQWVTLDNFTNLKLLHAQKEAFLFVKCVLEKTLNKAVKDYVCRKK